MLVDFDTSLTNKDIRDENFDITRINDACLSQMKTSNHTNVGELIGNTIEDTRPCVFKGRLGLGMIKLPDRLYEMTKTL